MGWYSSITSVIVFENNINSADEEAIEKLIAKIGGKILAVDEPIWHIKNNILCFTLEMKYGGVSTPIHQLFIASVKNGTLKNKIIDIYIDYCYDDYTLGKLITHRHNPEIYDKIIIDFFDQEHILNNNYVCMCNICNTCRAKKFDLIAKNLMKDYSQQYLAEHDDLSGLDNFGVNIFKT